MSVKWTRNQSESGILRKSEFKEKKEELFVFGYSCKLFRDDEKALHIDQGKHLIPWMGDHTLKIDRYDARGALHDLSTLEAPPGGFDWRVELTKNELDVEQLCDEERYRALHTDEDEEEMYREEELKRLHAAGYGQVGFNYETPAEPHKVKETEEVDDPFIAPAALIALLPIDIVLPDTEKLNAIIDKTANFIATQGTQMEILLRAKQKDNTQFEFLNKDSPLHPYYIALIELVKAKKWPESIIEAPVEEKPIENEDYLHPSLASTVIESAPAIPSIQYRPSADCDYTLLVCKMTGAPPAEERYEPTLAPGELPPPGTQPLPPAPPRPNHQISRPPVLYSQQTEAAAEQQAKQTYYERYAAYYQQYMAQVGAGSVPMPIPPGPPALQAPGPAATSLPTPQPAPGPPALTISTGLSLMKNYDTDSDSDATDSEDSASTDSKEKEQTILKPPDDVITVIEKMAAYVARNGDEFAEIVRAKNDPRFTFLESSNQYHAFYLKLMKEKRGVSNGAEKNIAKKKEKKSIAPVSFSIKKLKEPDPVLPKPALPYESSSEDESEVKQTETKSDTSTENQTKSTPSTNDQMKLPIISQPAIPPVIMYKIENPVNTVVHTVEKFVEPIVAPKIIENNIKETTSPKPEVKIQETETELPKPDIQPKAEIIVEQTRKQGSCTPERKRDIVKVKEEVRLERKPRERTEYRTKSENRDVRPDRNSERERDRRRHKAMEKERKRRKHSRDELENEIINLEDNSEEMIDLTGDHSDSKGEETEADKAKQLERRRRAAEFLKKVGVDPSAAALPTSSLASAMVDTLESLRKKKAEEEEKRRRREKRRYKHDYDERDSERSHKKSKRRKYEDEEEEYDSSKKKKRRKDKKHSSSKSKKKKRRTEIEDESIQDPPLNIDITSTLKGLRTSSPTKELLDLDNIQKTVSHIDSSGSEDIDKVLSKKEKRSNKKENREYSEGEWSSDSEADSLESNDRNEDSE